MTQVAYLLDTNACIDFLLGRSARLAERMAAPDRARLALERTRAVVEAALAPA